VLSSVCALCSVTVAYRYGAEGVVRQICDAAAEGLVRQVCDAAAEGLVRQICDAAAEGLVRQICDALSVSWCSSKFRRNKCLCLQR
jgi:hypothetical protein